MKEYIKNNESIKFPIFSISYQNWDTEAFQEFIILEDNIYNSEDDEYFLKYFQNQTYADSNGHLFKVIGKTDYFTKKFFLFTVKKGLIQFDKTDSSISFSEFMDLFEDRLKTVNSEKGKQVLVDCIRDANSIGDVIEAFY